MNAPELDALQADALREVTNVCAGRAADALSKRLGNARVGLELPEAERVPLRRVTEHLGGPDARVVGARIALAGPVEGELWLTLPEADADRLASQAGIGEVAELVARACAAALLALTRLVVTPGAPELVRARAEDVVGRIQGDPRFLMTTELAVAGAPVRGRLLLMPLESGVAGLLRALGLAG